MNIHRAFDPWEAADRLGLDIKREPLRRGRGYTDGHSTVWLHEGLTPREASVTLCHELVHVTQAHCGEQPPAVEELVCKVTARWLVPWQLVTEAWPDLCAVADALHVTPEVVRDRVRYATHHELSILGRASCDSRAA